MQQVKRSPQKNLIVYKASAGSGKTFSLVSEYLALAIRVSISQEGEGSADVAQTFGKILAITFTNKATAEMKIRILNTLYNIAHASNAAKDYIVKIRELLGGLYTDEDIIRGANHVLTGILHNYDSFDIKTIDSFYRGIVGNIAIMVGFHSNLEVYLDDAEAISNAVDNIIGGEAFEGNRKKDHYIYLLDKYVESHIEEDTSWDFRRGLKEFGKNICREVYMMNSERICTFFDNDAKVNDLMNNVRALKYKCENTLASLVDGFLSEMERHGVDFGKIKSGKNLGKYLHAVKNHDNVSKAKTGANFSSSADYWVFAKSSKQFDAATAQIIKEVLFPAFCNLEARRKQLQYKINSAELTLANMNDMRMLSMIDEEVKKESRESNRILLSKSQELIKSEVRSAGDISFVFEQAGKHYVHIMLDEAQDTSQMQWDNLGSLLFNTVSNVNGRSVIVGDVKQSIYRWRNGNWKILAQLADGNGSGAFRGMTVTNTLRHNYRSEENIVDFNSAFFTAAAAVMDGKARSYCLGADYGFGSIYADVEQVAAKKGGHGYVQIDTISAQRRSGEKTTRQLVDDRRLEILCSNIERLHGLGLPYSEMGILVRRNSELALISDYAKEHSLPFNINTNEAYSITNATSVRMIIAAMRIVAAYARDSGETLDAVYLALESARLHESADFDLQAFFTNVSALGTAEQRDGSQQSAVEMFKGLLPEALTANIDYLAELPINVLAAELTSILDLEKISDESAYIFTFLDFADMYAQKNAYDIERFLDDWDMEAAKQKISVADADGITAMTIHSAKGLEFHTVFMPFCDWELVPGRSRNLLWCSPEEEPFSEVPLLPVEYKTKDAESVYASDYAEENFNILVDNLNTLYVAFTRAKANLLIEMAAPSDSDSIASERISNIVNETFLHAAFIARVTLEPHDVTSEYDDCVRVERLSLGLPDRPSSRGDAEEHNTSKNEHFLLDGLPVNVVFGGN